MFINNIVSGRCLYIKDFDEKVMKGVFTIVKKLEKAVF